MIDHWPSPLVFCEVLTVKLADVAPPGTVTVAGTVAHRVSWLDRATVTPPLGAGLTRVTVPVEGLPPVTVDGFSESVESVPGGISSSVIRFVMEREARIVTGVIWETACVVTLNETLLVPAGMITLAGTDASAGLVLPRVTTAPPGGAFHPGRNETVP